MYDSWMKGNDSTTTKVSKPTSGFEQLGNAFGGFLRNAGNAVKGGIVEVVDAVTNPLGTISTAGKIMAAPVVEAVDFWAPGFKEASYKLIDDVSAVVIPNKDATTRFVEQALNNGMKLTGSFAEGIDPWGRPMQRSSGKDRNVSLTQRYENIGNRMGETVQEIIDDIGGNKKTIAPSKKQPVSQLNSRKKKKKSTKRRRSSKTAPTVIMYK
jgi:hypothetical protein